MRQIENQLAVTRHPLDPRPDDAWFDDASGSELFLYLPLTEQQRKVDDWFYDWLAAEHFDTVWRAVTEAMAGDGNLKLELRIDGPKGFGRWLDQRAEEMAERARMNR